MTKDKDLFGEVLCILKIDYTDEEYIDLSKSYIIERTKEPILEFL